MIKHLYSNKEIKKIREHFHNMLEFKRQFEEIVLNEDEVISAFLSGNFDAGSLRDPLLDCFGTPIFQYKFTNHVPKRINNMNTPINTPINNLPHIVEAEVVPQNAQAVVNKESKVINCDFCTITYDVKPSSKKPGKAIVFGSWNRAGKQFDFKYVTGIDNASEQILEAKFNGIARLINILSHFNIDWEPVEDAKNTINVKFEPVEVDTYGQFYEIGSVEKQVEILKESSLMECLQEINEASLEYTTMLETIANSKNTFREVTIEKEGKKNVITYIAESSPEVVGSLIKLTGNITSEVTWTSVNDIKSISEHVITENDLKDMQSVVYSDEADNNLEVEGNEEPESED